MTEAESVMMVVLMFAAWNLGMAGVDWSETIKELEPALKPKV